MPFFLSAQEMRNVPNILIVSLSLGDFLLILVSVPVTSFLYTFIHWPFGTSMCRLNEYIQTLSLGVSVFTLTALSADRYVAIVQPMTKLTCCSRRATVGVALAIWLLSAVLAIPDAVFSTENTSQNITACWLYPEELASVYPKFIHSAKLIVFFILPVLTIGFFYIMMARMLIRSNKSVPTESKTAMANHHRQIAARKKVARVVLSFVVIFIICWLPRHVFIMWYWFTADLYNQFWHTFKITAFCLQFVNSCVNPFALYFLSRQFRMYYNRYLFCCCRVVWYSSLEPSSTMHNMHGTTRRTSPTSTSLVHSQSMC